MENHLQIEKMSSPEIFNSLAPKYDLLNGILSLGIDKSWRTYLVSRVEKFLQQNDLHCVNGIDIATGTGDLIKPICQLNQVSKLYCLDPAKNMLEMAKKKNSNLKKDIEYICSSAQVIPLKSGSLSFASLSFGLRNMPDYDLAIDEIYRVLAPKGKLFLLEFSIPSNLFIRTFYLVYLRYILPKVGSILSGHKRAYKYLNQTVEDFPYGERMKKILEKHHFEVNSMQPLTFGICTLYEASKN